MRNIVQRRLVAKNFSISWVGFLFMDCRPCMFRSLFHESSLQQYWEKASQKKLLAYWALSRKIQLHRSKAFLAFNHRTIYLTMKYKNLELRLVAKKYYTLAQEPTKNIKTYERIWIGDGTSCVWVFLEQEQEISFSQEIIKQKAIFQIPNLYFELSVFHCNLNTLWPISLQLISTRVLCSKGM